MRRRRFLLGFSALAAGSVGAVGSGAFTSVSAKRDAEVDLENDANAYLGLFELGDGGRSATEDGLVTFQFPSDSEPSSVGLGTDSIYDFATDANDDQKGLFEVVNQGATTVDVYAEQVSTQGVPSVTIFDVDDPGRTTLDGNPNAVTLAPGESFAGGIRIDTHGVPITDDPYEATLRLRAER